MEQGKSFFDKNVELWEQWSKTYMDTMQQAMERVVGQSDEAQRQFQQAINATLEAQFEATRVTLEALQRQMEMLSEQVERLAEQQRDS